MTGDTANPAAPAAGVGPEDAPPPARVIELAVLDAPVLGRNGVTGFLLRLADAGAFDPIWSDQIHADWIRDVQRSHPTLPAERLRARRVMLDRAFPAANIAVSREALDEVLAHCTAPSERKTAHVLATAVSARAAVIVSLGLFRPRAVLKKLWHGTALMSPDEWCLDLLAHKPDAVLAGARAHHADRGESASTWLARLAEPVIGLPRTAARLAAMGDWS